MSKLVLLRHGQSIWNLENRFTGWVDVDLTKTGELEAESVAKKLINIKFGLLCTSMLIRAIRTSFIILNILKQTNLKVIKSNSLNERHYGYLQGLNKNNVKKKYGDYIVYSWRRSYSFRPPGGESLKDTELRVLPFYYKYIVPYLNKNVNILVIAHGNSLRSLIKHIENINKHKIIACEIHTCVPICYLIDKTKNITKQIEI